MFVRYSRRLALALAALAVALATPGVVAGRPAMPEPVEVIRQVVEANLLDPESGWMRPSPSYSGNWLRDAFWTSGYLGPRLSRRALDHFGSHLSPEGQAPTRLETLNGPAHFYDDESTLLYVIWSARDGGQPRERVARAWNWVQRHVSDGAYWTPAGNFHAWYDTLLFLDRDVLAYNQGLYVAAALGAALLEIARPSEVEAALSFYRWLYRQDLGYLPISLRLDYHDASALAGEQLARSLFARSALDDASVIATVRALPRAGPGFLVLSARDGSYLDPSRFFLPSAKGRYQNGGSWLLYDALSWSAASSAGAPEARRMGLKRLALEAADGTLYEHLPTGPAAVDTPMRDNYAWNSYAAVALGLPSGWILSPQPAWTFGGGSGTSTVRNAP